MKKLLHLPLQRQRYVPENSVQNEELTPASRQEDDRTSGTQVPFQALTSPHPEPVSGPPVVANFDSTHLVIGGGVAIFHLASARVVVCRHSERGFWFLPKGRRDAGEDTGAGAEREGFEESGYRNRLLPVPLKTLQPKAHNPSDGVQSTFVTDHVWTQLAPQSRKSQYLLFWFIAETVPPKIEEELNEAMASKATESNPTPYQYPPKYPADLTLPARIELEGDGYEPVHHKHTAVNAEEALYESHLTPVEDALVKLRGSVMEEVVRVGWNAICARHEMETPV
ncbi:hypothetical protein MMC30_005761 [Trapelia coarctata]|nr:hypothetical protein [Trapelia coarctata]